MAARATLILGLLATLGCVDPEVEALEKKKLRTQETVEALTVVVDRAKAELASRPARAPSFEQRAKKLVEIFEGCAAPCAKTLQSQAADILDEEQHAKLRPVIGACLAECVK